MRYRQHTGKRYICFLTAAVLLLPAAGLLTGCGQQEEAASEASAETETVSQAVSSYDLEYNGKYYDYNRDLTNILFLGIDKSDVIDTEYEMPGDAGQSDCIILLSLNDETQEGMILQINRNTMVELDLYDSAGSYAESLTGQIALQYAYSTGGSKSCYAAKKKIQELLYGLQIDGYLALDVSGIPEINDALGGVEVTCSYDYTDIDSAYTEGSTVQLEGETAQTFVQYRDTTVFNSVEDRMHRQVDYVTGLITTMNHSGGEDLYDILEPYFDTYIISDLQADEMNALKNYTYLTDDVLYLPGETQMGEKYEEFYTDADALQELIIETFYTEVDEDGNPVG